MKYLLIFLFGCTQTIERAAIQGFQLLEKDQYIVYDQPEFPDDYHQIEYIGNWVHMSHGGSYAHTLNDTARFAFWGYGIQIRTELMIGHKAYQVIIDSEFIESVNVQNDVNTVKNLTYSNMELSTGNHVIELVPDGGYFVLNSLTIHYYIDPTPGIECDSINWIDSIRWEIRDSTRWIEKDTLIIKDSTIMHYDTLRSESDTIYYLLQPKFQYDTLKL